MVHGDDFVSTGAEPSLKWLESILNKEFKIKTSIIGPDKNDNKEIKILNRIIRYTEHGIELEADLRHAELIVAQLGLKESKELSCSAADEIKRDDDDEELNSEYTTQYKSIVARANYLSTDRPDIQYAVKKLATSMSKPTNRNWQELKRLGRYLKGEPRLVIKYNWQNPISVLTAYSDSDWAGDKKSRKSTSGGVIMIGSHYIKSWSKNQSVIALSSAEAELYGIIKSG